MGFEDGRTNNPNRAWQALQDLAESRGVLTKASKRDSSWEKIEKRMQAVRKSLRSYFGLEGDPLPYLEGTGYGARFKIRCTPPYHS